MFLTDRLHIATKREYTDEGFLKVPARIARVGIQNYTALELGLKDRKPDEIIRVYRPPEEVFSDASLKSFTNKPVTNNHPPQLLTPDNAKQYSVGMSGPEVTKEGDYAETVLNITDGMAIKDIESGKAELSNGYTADIEFIAGFTPKGETYDAIQRNIKGNHIAIVTSGRAGAACRLADTLTENGDNIKMATITVDGVSYEVSEQASQVFSKVKFDLADTKDKLKDKEDELKKKEDEKHEEEMKSKKTEDSLNAKIDDLKSKVPSSETMDSLVVARTTAIDEVLKVAPTIDWKDKDIDSLRKEAVTIACPTLNLDKKTVDYVNARFDILVETAGVANVHSISDALGSQVKTKPGAEIKDTRSISVIARDNFMKRSKDAWKSGGSK